MVASRSQYSLRRQPDAAVLVGGALLTTGSRPSAEIARKALSVSEHLGLTARTGRLGKPLITGEQCRVQRLGEGHVHRVPPAQRVSQLPRAIEQQPMAESLRRPRFEILDGLTSGSTVESASPVLSAHDAENLDVYDVRRGLVRVNLQSLPNGVGPCGTDQHFVQAGSVNDQHPAMPPDVHPAQQARRSG